MCDILEMPTPGLPVLPSPGSLCVDWGAGQVFLEGSTRELCECVGLSPAV